MRILRAKKPAIDGRSEDISEGGLLIIAPASLMTAEEVDVRFALPISGAITTVKAIARWVKAARDDKGAVGVEFVGLDDKARAEIVSYAKHFSI